MFALLITLMMSAFTCEARIQAYPTYIPSQTRSISASPNSTTMILESYDDLVSLNTEQFIGIACAIGIVLLISIVLQVHFYSLKAKIHPTRFYEPTRHIALRIQRAYR